MNDNVFTFAELEFIAKDEPSWEDVRQLLSIGPVGDGVVAAGASSLLMRDLARLTDGQLKVRPDVSAHVALLFRPSKVVSVARADGTGLNLALALLPRSGAPTCLVSLGGPGIYEVTALKPAEDAAAQLAELIVALAKDGTTAMAIGPKDAPGELLLGHDGTTWRLGRTADDPTKHGTTTDQDEITRTLLTWLRSWLVP